MRSLAISASCEICDGLIADGFDDQMRWVNIWRHLDNKVWKVNNAEVSVESNGLIEQKFTS